MATHTFNSGSDDFDAILSGAKTAELRRIEDEDFKVGDFVILVQMSKFGNMATGRRIIKRITHVQGNFLFGQRLRLISYGPGVTVDDKPQMQRRWPAIHGVGRNLDSATEISAHFRTSPNDEELRNIHEALRNG